jgi:hypothetical protein
MIAAQFRVSLAALGLSQVKAARFLGRNPRTIRRYVSSELPVPRHIQITLNLMLKTGLKPGDLPPLASERTDYACR